MNLFTFLAEGDAAAAPAGGTNMLYTIGMIVVMVALFYFLMMRPEKKKKKKLQEMRDNLATGDTITTIGGIVGDVVHKSENYIVIETGDDRVRIKFAKWAVSTIGKADEEPK
jgi:preprotein translocase subunit YajC